MPGKSITINSHKQIAKLNFRGFGLIEVLVSLGLLVMTFVLATPLILSQRKVLSQITAKSHCSTTLNNMMGLIQSEGGLSGSLDFSQTHNQFVVDLIKVGNENPTYASLIKELIDFNHDEQEIALFQAINDPYGGVVVQNHQLILGSMGLMAMMYNSPSFQKQQICTNGAPQFNLLKNSTPLSENLKNLLPKGHQDIEINLAIVPYDINTRQELDCKKAPQSLWPRPRNAHGLQEVFLPNDAEPLLKKRILKFPTDSFSQYGFVARLRLSYTDSDGTAKSCTSNQRFEYPIDQGVVFLPREANGQILKDQQQLERDFVKNFKPMGVKETFVWNTTTENSYGTFGWQKSLNRELCSQPTINHASFDLDIKIPNHIEPGSIVLCRDLSLQRAQADNRGMNDVTWCNGAANAKVPLGKQHRTDPDTGVTTGPHPFAHPPDSSWVPCDQLQVCNTLPSKKWTRQEFNSQIQQLPNPDLDGFVLRYETQADSRNLWGCDVYVDMAVVDMAGNFLSLAMTTHNQGIDYLKEGAAEIYFKTTDCYLCKKKRRGLGGAFGSFFNILVAVALFALTVVSGGTLAPIFFGSLTAACMFICHSNYDDRVEHASWSGRLKRECEPRRRHKCKRVRAPSQVWTSSLLGTGDGCQGTHHFDEPMQSKSFDYNLVHGDGLYKTRYDLELIHDGIKGWSCIINKECINGALVTPQDHPDPDIDIDNFNGCTPIYVLTEVKEGGLSTPATGVSNCTNDPYPPDSIKPRNQKFEDHQGQKCLISGPYTSATIGVETIKGTFLDDNGLLSSLSYSPTGKICNYRHRSFTYHDPEGLYHCTDAYFQLTTADEVQCFEPGEIVYIDTFNYSQHRDLNWCESEDFFEED